MGREVGQAQVGQAALPRAQHLAGAAQPQVLLGDAEAVLGLAQDRRAAPWRSRRAAGRRAAGRSTWRPPRPTRPRSWCSWARPKRSACSITITVASGTSTPTSITVVATRIDSRPVGEGRHRRLALGALQAAVHQADLAGEARAQQAKRSSAAARSIVLGFLDQRADPVDARAACDLRGRRRRPPRRCARAAGCGCRSAGGRPASRSAWRRRDRHRPPASGCAGSASRSSPAGRRHGP